MRILYLAPRPPFPAEGRETVRPYHQLRQLALRHDVDLMCFAARGVQEMMARDRLSKFCHRVTIVPFEAPAQQPTKVVNLFSRRAFSFRRYFRREFLERLHGVAHSDRYDLVFAYSTAMAPYLSAFPGVPRVLDLVEVGSLRWLEQARFARFPASSIYRAEASRLMRVEREGLQNAHRVLFASDSEARHFETLFPEAKGIAAVKTPVNPRASLRGSWSAEPSILFTGNLNHFPNRDAAGLLLNDIFPRIKQLCRSARLVIAGKSPTREIRDLAGRVGAEIVPATRELPRLFRDAWVAVAPHRITHGIRNEIVEAMALGLPVVATKAAVNGLDLVSGKDLIVESNPARFAAEVARLLEDPAQIDKLGTKARRAVHNNYSHWSTAIRLEELIHEAALVGLGIETETRPSD
jgi:sugar transferase (PEP-CTERM/EpsH1 system associated)